MDEALIRGLTRQLKILNTWLAIVGGIILVTLAVCIFLIVKVFMFVNETQDKVTNLQQKVESSLDVRQQLCDTNSVGSFLNNRSDFCAKQ